MKAGARSVNQSQTPLTLRTITLDISRRSWVDADHDGVVVGEMVWRHHQVGRRGDALVDAAGHVELRLVAGAEVAALPLGIERGGADLGDHLRRAAKVRAQAHQ